VTLARTLSTMSTTPPLDPDNPRSGRWQGQKLECGIHIQASGNSK